MNGVGRKAIDMHAYRDGVCTSIWWAPRDVRDTVWRNTWERVQRGRGGDCVERDRDEHEGGSSTREDGRETVLGKGEKRWTAA